MVMDRGLGMTFKEFEKSCRASIPSSATYKFSWNHRKLKPSLLFVLSCASLEMAIAFYEHVYCIGGVSTDH